MNKFTACRSFRNYSPAPELSKKIVLDFLLPWNGTAAYFEAGC
jgi:hypothetical protein